tara:strand:+ start:147 stop:470 length:324 start_codon:yes stop_codon:yes gene_type:complete
VYRNVAVRIVSVNSVFSNKYRNAPSLVPNPEIDNGRIPAIIANGQYAKTLKYIKLNPTDFKSKIIINKLIDQNKKQVVTAKMVDFQFFINILYKYLMEFNFLPINGN